MLYYWGEKIKSCVMRKCEHWLRSQVAQLDTPRLLSPNRSGLYHDDIGLRCKGLSHFPNRFAKPLRTEQKTL